MMAIEISRLNGYMALDSWVMANVIQLCTDDFCDRFVTSNPKYRIPNEKDILLFDPTGRQYDQMTQAARSAPANIAEGYSRHQTSSSTEMTLLDVARATLHELKNDYFHFLLRHHFTPWNRNDEGFIAVSSTKMDRAQYGENWDADAAKHILMQKARFAQWLDGDAITAARTIFILCDRGASMTERFIAYRLEEFKQSGGFSENLSNERNAALTKQALSGNAPKCPVCGAPMIKKTCQRGSRIGRQFWSCSNYSSTGCRGTINID
jgi:restriction system protein